jgi:hypothetical protein
MTSWAASVQACWTVDPDPGADPDADVDVETLLTAALDADPDFCAALRRLAERATDARMGLGLLNEAELDFPSPFFATAMANQLQDQVVALHGAAKRVLSPAQPAGYPGGPAGYPGGPATAAAPDCCVRDEYWGPVAALLVRELGPVELTGVMCCKGLPSRCHEALAELRDFPASVGGAPSPSVAPAPSSSRLLAVELLVLADRWVSLLVRVVPRNDPAAVAFRAALADKVARAAEGFRRIQDAHAAQSGSWVPGGPILLCSADQLLHPRADILALRERQRPQPVLPAEVEAIAWPSSGAPWGSLESCSVTAEIAALSSSAPWGSLQSCSVTAEIAALDLEPLAWMGRGGIRPSCDRIGCQIREAMMAFPPGGSRSSSSSKYCSDVFALPLRGPWLTIDPRIMHVLLAVVIVVAPPASMVTYEASIAMRFFRARFMNCILLQHKFPLVEEGVPLRRVTPNGAPLLLTELNELSLDLPRRQWPPPVDGELEALAIGVRLSDEALHACRHSSCVPGLVSYVHGHATAPTPQNSGGDIRFEPLAYWSHRQG